MGTTVSHETHPSERFPDGFRYWADFEQGPFSEGMARYAFRGTYHGSGPRNNTKCVAKVFKRQFDGKLEDWQPDLEAHRKAAELAEKFSALEMANKTIRFQQPVITKIDNVSSYKLFGCIKTKVHTEHIMGEDYVSLEDFIDGKWEKFNSNSGWSCSFSSLIPAFSHYTYDASHGELLVCDIQGVRCNDEYILTDPAICSRDQRYGITDTGALGIAQFFSGHECSKLCHKMLRPRMDPAAPQTRNERQRPRRYSFDLSPDQERLNQLFRNRHDLPVLQEY